MRTDAQAETYTMKKIRKWYKKELQAEAIENNNRVWSGLYNDLQSRHRLMIIMLSVAIAALLIENVILIVRYL